MDLYVAPNGNDKWSGSFSKPNIQADSNRHFDTTGKPHFLMVGKKYSFKQWQALGRDRHSIVADPRFVNLKKRNLTLAKGSPAFRLGFKAIDLSTVGPRPAESRE